jgi:hypothetical protein
MYPLDLMQVRQMEPTPVPVMSRNMRRPDQPECSRPFVRHPFHTSKLELGRLIQLSTRRQE